MTTDPQTLADIRTPDEMREHLRLASAELFAGDNEPRQVPGAELLAARAEVERLRGALLTLWHARDFSDRCDYCGSPTDDNNPGGGCDTDCPFAVLAAGGLPPAEGGEG